MGIRYWAAVAFSGALGLTGCGGGEPSTQTETAYTGTISAISANSDITIVANGEPLTFDVSNAKIDSDSDGELAPGKVVTVEGEHDGINVGHASAVEYDSDVEGIVTDIILATDGSIDTISVMGQIVIVDSMTMFDERLSADGAIKVGNFIEVSGIFQDDGSILAKHIEFKTNGNIEIKGIVSNLLVNGDMTTFDLGACTVTVNAETVFQGMASAADLMEGIEVEVHSSMEAGSGMVDMSNGCQVIASKIELEDAREDEMQFEFEKGEVISELVEGSFTIRVIHNDGSKTDIVIVINEQTAIGGGTEADIVMGTMLHVQGNYDVNGNLVAKEIEVKSPMDMPKFAMASFSGTIDAIDTVGSTFMLMGQTIMVTDMTMIAIHAAPPIEVPVEKPVQEPIVKMAVGTDMPVTEMPVTKTLADIIVGDYARVVVEKNATGTWLALKLVVLQGVTGEPSHVEGRVSGVDAASDTIMIEGVSVPGVSMLRPELVLDESLIGNEAFARGSYSAGVLTAMKLEVALPDPVIVEPVVTEPVATKPAV